MKVGIDLNKCSRRARCYATNPEIFHLDETGYVLYSDVEIPLGEEEAQLAVDSCPERAISLR